MDLAEPQLLITDDDSDFRESLAELLNRRGFRTMQAEDGEHALQILQEMQIHLLMVDMHMPRLSGLDILASVRQMPITLPCILMSAQLDESIVRQAKLLSTESVLSKPFNSQTITQTIQRLLRDRYGWTTWDVS